jgi:hypothetical protein
MIENGSSPVGKSLTFLGPELCEEAMTVVRYFDSCVGLSDTEAISRLRGGRNLSELAEEIDKNRRKAKQIADAFQVAGISMWERGIAKCDAIRKRIEELDEEQKLEARQRAALMRFREQRTRMEKDFENSPVRPVAELGFCFLETKLNKDKRRETITLLNNLLDQFNMVLVGLRDVKPLSSKLAKIVDGEVGRIECVWERSAINALIDYTVAENMILAAQNNFTFGTVIQALTAVLGDGRPSEIVDPFEYLVEAAIAGKAASPDDFEKLRTMNRIRLYHAAKEERASKGLVWILEGLLNGNEVVGRLLQVADLKGLDYIQFPPAKKSDLMACLRFMTPSGTFSGPFAPNRLSGEPKTIEEAASVSSIIRICETFLQESGCSTRVVGDVHMVARICQMKLEFEWPLA